jgi:AcrR family transcriptional regulator
VALGQHITDDDDTLANVRTEPTQSRSSKRLDHLLDAAAAIVDEGEAERMTTAEVAERAGASIGTVYRYFPDRLAILAALRQRATRRFRQKLAEELSIEHPEDWMSLLDTVVDVYVEMYRSEPGFSVIGAGNRERVEDDGDESRPSIFAVRLAREIAEGFDVENDADLRFSLDICVEIGEALVARAFATDPAGDERYIAECRRILHSYLGEHLATAESRASAA